MYAIGGMVVKDTYVTPTLGFFFTNKLSINNYFDVFSSVNSYSVYQTLNTDLLLL